MISFSISLTNLLGIIFWSKKIKKCHRSWFLIADLNCKMVQCNSKLPLWSVSPEIDRAVTNGQRVILSDTNHGRLAEKSRWLLNIDHGATNYLLHWHACGHIYATLTCFKTDISDIYHIVESLVSKWLKIAKSESKTSLYHLRNFVLQLNRSYFLSNIIWNLEFTWKCPSKLISALWLYNIHIWSITWFLSLTMFFTSNDV